MSDRKTAIDRIVQAGTVIPAHPLALRRDGALDEKRQRLLTKYYLHAGAGGVAMGVHTTQFAIRDPKHNLFRTVLTLAAEEANAFEKANQKTVVKIAGVCGKTPQAVAEASLAAELGYDCVLLSPGGLADLTEDSLLDRTRQVATILPVFGFYLQPAVGGRLFTPNYWRGLCEIEGVVAIKAAPFNRYQTLDVVRAVAMSDRWKDIALYTGNDDNIVLDLLAAYRFEKNGATREIGFRGGLLGHWAVWTRRVVEMFERIKTEKAKPAIAREMLVLAAEVTDCNAAFFDAANRFAGCIAGLHEVLRRQGILENIRCLDPSETLSPGQKEEIDRVYATYPHLADDQFVQERILPLL